MKRSRASSRDIPIIRRLPTLSDTAPCSKKEMNRCTDLVTMHSPPIEYTPGWFTYCTSLQTIDFLNTPIHTEGWLAAFPSTLLEITINRGHLPSQLAHLTRLESLIAINSPMYAIPPDVTLLGSLHTLCVDACGLKCLPSSLCNLIRLQSLKLAHNEIDDEGIVSISSLTALQTLSLSRNAISKLPVTFGGLTRLTSLDLSLNRFEAVPPFISTNAGLVSLNMCANRLTALPPAFCLNMTRLEDLNLRSNQLLSHNVSDACLWHFPALRTLNLDYCGLATLPRLSPETTRLTKLNVAMNNKLTEPPLHFMRLARYALKEIVLVGNASLIISCAPLYIVFKTTVFTGLMNLYGEYRDQCVDELLSRYGKEYRKPHATLTEYMEHCIQHIMLMRQYISQEQETDVTSIAIDKDALSYNISSHIANLFNFVCLLSMRGLFS